MQIIETSIFARQIVKLLKKQEYLDLRAQLAASPEAGVVIKGTGGARKLRWAAKGKGKSGGIRVIYYFQDSQGKIFLLLAYSKSDQDDLTPDQAKAVRKLVEGFKDQDEE
ncbi:MAG: hypothetical protein A2600_14110 [Candidatus Lambdaproteobacteria bacterium RIFOXYD1_FULL_56_27]|uniref:Addiction module toxin RelE n=1 Tax=Candidatus Lambdaproteobacteria bacterium RIFOXYD2_FULL_56_26 TaxID=1817773 RepID=A0A1F6H123_9PROT|nr:MAG: hypothetical protein A2557_14145 [Candidatus Lambdaproteobacteria bacterium RIFOXYD2_FULL_56_26]OGH08271.1 MAG: hypothetical protein A2600_14110 [Candidatus Lambdaproteobacteria bacterium RIFOXYD1_FULL_56_27]